VLLDERLQPGIILGGSLILVGVIITDRSYRRPGRLRTPSATG
jgi:drug/metabolite transporter (DMT)-like permease